MVISDRARTVLRQVVTLHYQTCEPVGSALIYKTRALSLSPATIRGIMWRLDRLGYLEQPHTSAGRLPTDLGYRAYVEDISLSRGALSSHDRSDLESKLNPPAAVGPALLETISQYLHKATQQLTFHIPFRYSGIKLKHIHFERINPDQLLVLWVATGGRAFQTLLNISDSQMSLPFIEKAENFFNAVFQGRSLMEIQRDIAFRPGSGGDQWDLLLTKVALIAAALAAEARELEDIRFTGVAELMNIPEFQNVERLRVIFNLLENKTKIKELIRKALECPQQWISFNIGKEMGEPDLEPLSIVLAKFRNSDDWLGCVGLLGPKRMPYLRSLQILATAHEKIALQPL